MGCKNSKSKIQISVKSFLDKTITLEVEDSDKIKSVKAKIQNRWKELGWETPPDQQRLMLGEIAKDLEDWHTVAECNIQNGSTLIISRF